MSLLSPITVLEAGPIVAEASGLRWLDNRAEIIGVINKYRELLYTQYDKLQLFDNVFHRVRVETYGCGCEQYQGFTLPADILSVEAVWDDGRSLTLHSRWREAHNGKGLPNSRVSTLEMAETFPTVRDLNITGKIKIFTEHADDHGKLVHMDVVQKGGRQKRLVFTLEHDGWAVSPVRVERIISVSLPTERVGGLRLAQEDNRELAVYAPNESVPVYRRHKVTASRCSTSLVLQGVKRFVPVWFDHDVVEVGNRLALDAAARHFRYTQGGSDAKEIQTGEYWLTKLNGYLLGQSARQRGGNIQDYNPLKLQRTKKNLPGLTKR